MRVKSGNIIDKYVKYDIYDKKGSHQYLEFRIQNKICAGCLDTDSDITETRS